MMNNPFFESYLNQQPSFRTPQFPVQQTQRKPSTKVVSVPVHFVSSEQPPTTASRLKESAALKIQRVFRGFLVRKSVKKIAAIQNEVREIERRISDVSVVESIRRDAKDRLKVNETLMSLLFKLDSIRGVDCGVRDFRKAVTKKAIALQEKVDSMVEADYQTLDSANNGPVKSMPQQVPDTSGFPDEIVGDSVKSALEQVPDTSDFHDEIVGDSVKSALEQVPDPSNPHDEIVDNSGNLEANDDSAANLDEESDAMEEVVKEMVENCNPVKAVDDRVEEIVETNPSEGLTEVAGENYSSEEGKVCEGRDDNQKNRELLEKLMDNNEKMMKLMMQIFERNEMQTRMLNSLSQRVEHLEKAFISEKLRRKKKRHVA